MLRFTTKSKYFFVRNNLRYTNQNALVSQLMSNKGPQGFGVADYWPDIMIFISNLNFLKSSPVHSSIISD